LVFFVQVLYHQFVFVFLGHVVLVLDYDVDHVLVDQDVVHGVLKFLLKPRVLVLEVSYLLGVSCVDHHRHLFVVREMVLVVVEIHHFFFLLGRGLLLPLTLKIGASA
jgi:hypothetical protein